MQYDPIKKTLGRFLSGSRLMRRILYLLLDILLLRTWHVKKALRRTTSVFKGDISILDAGCGFGQYSWRMSQMNNNWRIKAVDIDNEHIEDCRTFFAKAGLSERVIFETVDLTRLADSNCFNLILSVDVMEHIEEDREVFRNFNNALKDNGVLIISTPSDMGGSDVHNEDDNSFIEEHVRDGYSIKDITEKLSEAGFREINTLYTYGIPGNISWRLSMKYPVKMLNRSYLFFILLPFYYILVFPLFVILNFIDLEAKHGKGTGLLVTARK